MQTKHAISKKVKVPAKAKLLPIFSTVDLIQNTSELSFYSNPTNIIHADNFVNNPFTGTDRRRVLGLVFNLNKIFIRDDAANGIDSQKILNALKDSSVKFTADQNNQQFLHTVIEEHSNFSGTIIRQSTAAGHIDEADEVSRRKVAIFKPADFIKIPDPWDVARNQNISLKVKLTNSADLPTAQNWIDSDDNGNRGLKMQAIIFMAEIDTDGGDQ